MIFKALDGTLLYSQSDMAAEPMADVLLVHGLGEHSGRYEELSQSLQSWNLNVHRFDLRGHGRSGGLRGHVQSFRDYHSDIDLWIAALQGQDLLSEHRPFFLVAHSLGGLISLGYSARRKEVYGPKLLGVALSAPALGVPSPFASVQYLLAKGLPSMLQTIHIKNGIRPEQLCRNREVVRAYTNDPLVHGWVTPAFYQAFTEEIIELKDELEKLRSPLLFLLAGADSIVDTQAALLLAQDLKKRNDAPVEAKVFPDFYHEIFNENNREQPLLVLRKWMQSCMNTKALKKAKSDSSKSSKRKVTGKATSL